MALAPFSFIPTNQYIKFLHNVTAGKIPRLEKLNNKEEKENSPSFMAFAWLYSDGKLKIIVHSPLHLSVLKKQKNKKN